MPHAHWWQNWGERQHFVEQIRSVQVQPGEGIVSHDVKALFTLVPVDPAISIVQSKLLQDPFSPIGPPCQSHK